MSYFWRVKDLHIREILRETELLEYLQDPHSKVVEEMKLSVAKARIDIAVLNGCIRAVQGDAATGLS